MLKTLIAKPNGTDVVLAHYRNSAGENIVANRNEIGLQDPFVTETAAVLSVASQRSLKFSDVESQVTLIGTCEHCSSELFSTEENIKEMASSAMASDENHHYTEITCPHCAEIATLDAAGHVDPELRVTENEEEATAEAQEDEEAAADQEEDQEASADEQEDEEASADQEEDEEATAEAQEDEEAAADEDDQEQEEGDDEQEDEDQEEGDEEDTSSAAPVVDFKAIMDKMVRDSDTPETASVVDDESSTITYDVSSAFEFDPSTARVIPLRPGVMPVFVDNEAGQPVQIGTCHLEHASANNAKFFDKWTPESLRTMNLAFRAACGVSDGLKPFGFKPVVHEIAVTEAVEALASARVETASVEQEETASAYREGFQQCIATAMAGMHKGVYDNPLEDALIEALETRGFKGAARTVSAVLASAMETTMASILEKADEIHAKPETARAELASTIKGMKKRTVAAAREEASEVELSTAAMFDLANNFEDATPTRRVPNARALSVLPAGKRRLFDI